MGVFFALLFELLFGVEPLGVFLEVVHHRVTDRVGERCLFTEEYIVGQIVALERVAEQIFALAVGVHFFSGIDGHDIFHKVEIAERHARLKRVYGDAAVGAQNVVHVQLSYSLLRLLLEFLRARRKVGVFVAEQLVGDFACQKNSYIRVLVYPFAQQVHTHARADSRDIKCAEHTDDTLERV